MKKLFIYLLKKYSKTEKERLVVFEILYNNVSNEYNEQTNFGNVYNANIEFLMSSKLIKTLVKNKDIINLKKIEQGLKKSYIESINFINDECRR